VITYATQSQNVKEIYMDHPPDYPRERGNLQSATPGTEVPIREGWQLPTVLGQREFSAPVRWTKRAIVSIINVLALIWAFDSEHALLVLVVIGYRG
jgi:hypothetical protein